MPNDKDADKVQSEASEKSNSESADTPIKADASGLKIDEKVDVSNDALSQARRSLNNEVAEKVTENDNTSESKDESDNDTSDELDEMSKTILEAISAEEKVNVEKQEKREQTLEEKVKELERKNQKLMEKIGSSSIPETSQVEPKLSREEFLEQVKERYGWDEDEFNKRMLFMQDYKKDVIDPEINRLKSELADAKLKESLGDNKLYQKLRNEVDAVIANDPDLQVLPKEKAVKFAMLEVQKKRMPEIIKAIQKQEQAKAKANKRVITSDKTVSKGSTKEDKVSFNLDNYTIDDMKKLQVSKEDISKYHNKKLILE